MLDIKLIRDTPELVKNNLAKRGNPECLKMLDDLITTDREWRLNLTKLNELRHQRKQITIEIAKLKKACKEADNEFTKAQDIDHKNQPMLEKQITAEEQKIHGSCYSCRTCWMTRFRLEKTQTTTCKLKRGEPSQTSIFQ